MNRLPIGQVDREVTLEACIWEVLDSPAILTKDFRGFPQSFRANSGVVSILGSDHFLPNRFQFAIYHLSYLLKVSLRSLLKKEKKLTYSAT
jgi:hypothetical protein